jgi:hypothetical protein
MTLDGAASRGRFWPLRACRDAACRVIGLTLASLWLFLAGLAFAQESIPYRWRNVVVGGGGFASGVIFSRAEPGLAFLRTDMGGRIAGTAARKAGYP